jgi:hypothetical protein
MASQTLKYAALAALLVTSNLAIAGDATPA